MKTFGMSMNLQEFIKNNRYPRDYSGVFQDDTGRELSASEAASLITSEIAKGHVVIPASQECGNPCKHSVRGCTGFDHAGGGCPGRQTAEAGSKP